MNIQQLFQGRNPRTGEVTYPGDSEIKNENIFNAVSIPEFPNFRIAINVEGNPLLLLAVPNSGFKSSLKNFRLKNLKFEQNKECRILKDNEIEIKIFTIITFTNSNRNLHEFFLRISETLIKSLNNNLTQEQIIENLQKFIEVFQTLTASPTKTIQGLWAELFFINNATDPKILLNYWHNLPEEKFDFNSHNEKIEIKSSSTFQRIHTFSATQLFSEDENLLLIGSIFTKENNKGISISDLVKDITTKIQNEYDLINKLHTIILKTLGCILEDESALNLRFDYHIAKESLRFYDSNDIKKIEKINIPKEVTEVRYKSDLTDIDVFEFSKAKRLGVLLRAI